MGYRYIINPVELAKNIMNDYVKDSMTVCDCTVGNGNDTLLLAKLVGESGKVYGFDIQELAINNTKKYLEEESVISRVDLINDGHENIDRYIKESIDLSIYNLGYLPRGNKDITTDKNTSVESMSKSLELLKNNGLLLVTCYTGHKGGLDEKIAVEYFLSSLDQKKYNVLEFNFKNQKHNPPMFYCVEKR